VYGPVDALIAILIAPFAEAQVVGCVSVGVTTGSALTFTVAVIGIPAQPLAVGVIVKVTVTGAPVVLVNEPVISPEPLAAIPVTVAVLSLTHVYVVAPERTIGVIALPEQTDCAAGVATAVVAGYTSTVAVKLGPAQPPALLGIIVKVTVTGDPVVLVKLPVIEPVPLATIPVTVAVLSLVQVKLVPAPV